LVEGPTSIGAAYAKARRVTWVQLAEPDTAPAEPGEFCSWSRITAAVRFKASQLEAEAVDLREWADFLDALAALDAPRD
jgi:hypothetical protein